MTDPEYPMLPLPELLGLFSMMVTIRGFEEQVRRLASSGLVCGLTHLSSGQEATAAGTCGALRPDDYIASNHRGHGHCIAKGLDPRLLMAEILGRATGICLGRSGSMHVADPDTGNLGTNGIVGGGIPLATGAALSAKARGSSQVAICYFGDGALNQGILPECMNMAAIWSLPVIYVCENNGYGEYTAIEDVTAGPSLTARGEVFGIPSVEVDGMDVLAVYAATKAAVERARAGKGPSFLMCSTYRFGGHHTGDKQDYKDEAEIAAWKAKDPIEKLRATLLGQSITTAEMLDVIERDSALLIQDAVGYARNSPEPSVGGLETFVYA